MFFRYKNPTSSNAWRSWSKNIGLVSTDLARERSRIGMLVNDIMEERDYYAKGK